MGTCEYRFASACDAQYASSWSGYRYAYQTSVPCPFFYSSIYTNCINSRPKRPWTNHRIHTRTSSFCVCHPSTPTCQRAGQPAHCAHLSSTQSSTATFDHHQRRRRQRPPNKPQSPSLPLTSRDQPCRQPAIRPVQSFRRHPFVWPVSVRYRSFLIRRFRPTVAPARGCSERLV